MFTILALLAAFAIWYFRKEIAAWFKANPKPLVSAEKAVETELKPAAKPVPAPDTGAATPTAKPKA